MPAPRGGVRSGPRTRGADPRPPCTQGARACPLSTRGGTRRVQLVREEGRGVFSQYGREGGERLDERDGCGREVLPPGLGRKVPLRRARARRRAQGRWRGIVAAHPRGPWSLTGRGAGVLGPCWVHEASGLSQTCPVSTGRRTRRVQLVRGEGRDVSSQYRKWGGGGTAAVCQSPHAADTTGAPGRGPREGINGPASSRPAAAAGSARASASTYGGKGRDVSS